MARIELRGYHIQLQQTLAVVNRPDTMKNKFMPNLQILILNIDQNRVGTLQALGSQFQRMMQAAPLPRTGLNIILSERLPRPIGFPARPDSRDLQDRGHGGSNPRFNERQPRPMRSPARPDPRHFQDRGHGGSNPRFNEQQPRPIESSVRPDPLPNMQPRPRDVQAWGHRGFNPRFNEQQPRPIASSVRPDPLPDMQSYPLGSVEEFCDGALEFNGSGGKWQCSDCSFQALKHGFRNTFWPLPTRDAPLLYLHSWIFLTSHLKLRSDRKGGDFPLFGCQICPQPGQFTESNLKQHLQQHTQHQLKENFGQSVQVCDCRAPHGLHQPFCAVKRTLCNKELELERFSSGLPLHRWMSYIEFHQS